MQNVDSCSGSESFSSAEAEVEGLKSCRDLGGWLPSLTLATCSSMSVQPPEVPIYPMFAAWDDEKLLSTVRIMFSKPQRSFFK